MRCSLSHGESWKLLHVCGSQDFDVRLKLPFDVYNIFNGNYRGTLYVTVYGEITVNMTNNLGQM